MSNQSAVYIDRPAITPTGTWNASNVGDDIVLTPRRSIIIDQKDFGYLVTVGCQHLAIETPEKLIKNLKAYLDDPAAFENAWAKKKKLL